MVNFLDQKPWEIHLSPQMNWETVTDRNKDDFISEDLVPEVNTIEMTSKYIKDEVDEDE